MEGREVGEEREEWCEERREEARQRRARAAFGALGVALAMTAFGDLSNRTNPRMPMLSELPTDAEKRNAILDQSGERARPENRRSLTPKQRKAETTVAMDFGRITIDRDLVLYLFGTPGQQRFWFMWDDLCLGAIGAIVLVDTERLEDSFSPLDYFESKGLPFIVAVNQFDGTREYELDEVAAALALPPEVPIIRVDARDRESAKKALVRVTEYALLRLTQSLTVNAN